MENNSVTANKITHYGKQMYDVAAIYTLSAQSGTIINDNYIDSIYKAPFAHLPGHWFYIYTDEGSSNITLRDNWTPSEKYLQNANGPGNVWENNGPMVNDSVKANAGLQPAYNYLRKRKKAADSSWLINRELPVIIELLVKENQELDLNKLKQVLLSTKIDTSSIFHWKNHYVIFSKIQDVLVFTGKINTAFPGIAIKTYQDPFYEFNRSHCANKVVADKWDHIILTANLVADPKLQKEYLDYHKTQFAKWPEVSNGFCNADFQQLLLYKNGRQLMLVISIPKGESLDNLNPKTTENNPKVDEWNKLMKKYQQGIKGTKKDEVWVFFEQLTK
jgi:hypothetical protein